MTIEICPAALERNAEVLAVIERANPHLSRRFLRFRESGARWHDAIAITANADEVIASAAVIFRRAVWTPSGPALLGGIGAVATLPEMRCRGLATALLAECEAFLASEGYELAVLFCSIPPFYERQGWRPVVEPELRLPASADVSGWDLRCINMNSIPDDIRTLYSSAATGALVRDSGIWHEYSAWIREDPDLFWAAFDNGCLRGYARARRSGDAIEVVEATCAPSYEMALSALLRKQLTIASTSTLLRPSTTMMIKPLFPACRSDRRMLAAADFEKGLPWQTRIWWPIDRF